MRITVHFFFREAIIVNRNKIPLNKPVVFSSNHPNSFMDAIVLAVLVKKQLYFLVRSDMFNTPLKRTILGWLNMAPIYRIQEGADQLHKNEETFKQCNALLKQNKNILIFSEGLCVVERKLRKLKKGMARIALGAEEQTGFSLDLQIVPVGINYSKHNKFRSKCLIEIGEPVGVSKYKTLWYGDKAKAINTLTSDVESSMEKLIVHLPDDGIKHGVEVMEHVYGNEYRKLHNLSGSYKADIKISQEFANKFNQKRMETPSLIHDFNKLVEAYRQKVILIKGSKQLSFNYSGSDNSVVKYIAAIFLFPFALIGALIHGPAAMLATYLTRRIVKTIEFYASVLISLGFFLWLIFFIIELCVISSVINSENILIYFLLVAIVTGISLIWFIDMCSDIRGQKRKLAFDIDPRYSQLREFHDKLKLSIKEILR